MIHSLASLICAVAALVLITAALVYIVSPKHGSELLRRLGIFLAGALLGLCLLLQFSAHIGPLSLMLLGFVVMVTAYSIFEARRGSQPRRALPRRGAERTPVVPQHDAEVPDE